MGLFQDLLDWLRQWWRHSVPLPEPDPAPVPAGDVLGAVNAARARHGQPAFREDATLTAAAQGYAATMAARGVLSHDLAGPLTGRLLQAGYAPLAAGEVIAAGQRTADAAVASWLDSPGHRAIVLNGYADAGGGWATAADGQRYWCVVCATRR